MSAILGIFNRDGKPVKPSELEKMIKPMNYWGPDGSETWLEGGIGLGQLLLQTTPESKYENLPIISKCRNYVLTAACRIDNREELLKIFNISSVDQSCIPDSALILRAYEKWGEECPDRLLGDWSFAVWDKKHQKLFLARDHLGNSGLYYTYSSRTFLFSSCLKGLLAQPLRPLELNELRIAQILTAWPEDGFPTCYKNIFRLPPAHSLSVTKNDLRVTRYWRLEDAPKIRLSSDQEYLDAFMEVYAEAVRCRLRSIKPVAVALSGGLDSGSVAALAARELKKQNQRLQAFSSIPIYNTKGLVREDQMGDESPMIKATAEFAGNIDISFILAENISPLDGIRKSLYLHDEPVHAASNSYWIHSLLGEAQNRGFGSLLVGQKGNGTVSWHCAGYLAWLAVNFRWRTLQKELPAWSRSKNRPLWRTILGYIIKPSMPWSMKTRYIYLKQGRRPWLDYSAINIKFADQLSLTRKMFRQKHDPTFGITADPNKNRYYHIGPGRDIVGCLLNELGAGHAVEIRDPTIDKRLMAFCCGIPHDLYFRNGSDRFLIRRAMKDLLPGQVIWNQHKGHQAADLVMRVKNSSAQIQSALENLKKYQMPKRILDLGRISQVFQDLRQSADPEQARQTLTILMRGLTVGMFIAGFEELAEAQR